MEVWSDDPNEYVADEDDDQRFNARSTCTTLVQVMQNEKDLRDFFEGK